MEIVRDDQAKMVQVWMTNQERQDTALQRQMKPMYAQWKRENFLVAVFQSGPRELQTSTRDLLSYNKKRIAQMEVARNKGRKCAVQERG